MKGCKIIACKRSRSGKGFKGNGYAVQLAVNVACQFFSRLHYPALYVDLLGACHLIQGKYRQTKEWQRQCKRK